MNDTDKQPTCAERVKQAMQSRMADLKILYRREDCEKEELESFLKGEGRDIEDLEEDDLQELIFECQSEYGLSFDYVPSGTFTDQDQGYFRYQISYGGPSEEIRMYTDAEHAGCYSAEFWFLDWFDGAKVVLTSDELDTARAMFQDFLDCGVIGHALKEAARSKYAD